MCVLCVTVLWTSEFVFRWGGRAWRYFLRLEGRFCPAWAPVLWSYLPQHSFLQMRGEWRVVIKCLLRQSECRLEKNFQTQRTEGKSEFIKNKEQRSSGHFERTTPDRPGRVDSFCELVANFYSHKTKKIPAGRLALGDCLGCYRVWWSGAFGNGNKEAKLTSEWPWLWALFLWTLVQGLAPVASDRTQQCWGGPWNPKTPRQKCATLDPWRFRFIQFSSVAQSWSTLYDPMNCSMPGLPVHHQLPESTQTHVHWIGDAIQTSHPLLSPSPPALSLSQHQALFKWVSCLHQVAKVLEFQLQHQSFQWIFRTDFL